MKKQKSQNINISYSPYRSQFREIRKEEIKQTTKQEKTTIKFQISPSLVIVSLFVLSLSLGFLEVLTSNKVATKGYDLKRMQVSQAELQSQSETANQYLADAKSMKHMLNNPSLSNLRAPSNIQYVNSQPTEVAKAY